jgi:hypothetical protein
MLKRSLLVLAFISAPALADPPVVNFVKAKNTGSTWTFDVTLTHGDTGWDDYADGWRVVDANGTVLGTRMLAHPHVNEQPFTRSLSGVIIPEGTRTVGIQPSDSRGGWSPNVVQYTLP